MKQLEKFPAKYNELESELLPSKGQVSERVSGSGESSPIPVRLETLHLRSGGMSLPLMAHEAKMRVIRHETKLVWDGERRSSEINRITLTSQYIIKRGDWAHKEYDSADKLAVTIISISHKIQFVLGHKSDDIVLGKCPTLGDDGKACGVTLKLNPQQLDRTLEIKCRACGTVWESTKWRLLGKILQE
jgi:hypothetical protein